MHVCVFQLTQLTPAGMAQCSPLCSRGQGKAGAGVLGSAPLHGATPRASPGEWEHSQQCHPRAVRYVAMRGTSLAAMGKGRPSPPLSTRYSSSSFSW